MTTTLKTEHAVQATVLDKQDEEYSKLRQLYEKAVKTIEQQDVEIKHLSDYVENARRISKFYRMQLQAIYEKGLQQ